MPETKGNSLFAQQIPPFAVKESMCAEWALRVCEDFMQSFAALERPANGRPVDP
jgi:hypothetical protein